MDSSRLKRWDFWNLQALSALEDLKCIEYLELLEHKERQLHYTSVNRNNDLDELDEEEFKKKYHFNKSTVEKLVLMFGKKIKSYSTKNRAISPTEKVLTALKFLSSGFFQVDVADEHNISQASTSKAINTVVECLVELQNEYIYLPQSETGRLEMSQKFLTKYGFPSVYGILGCTLIKILNPGGSEAESFKCCKKNSALNIQTLSDADMFIRNIIVQWPGRTPNNTIFENSQLKAHLESKIPNWYHLLGDNSYPVQPYLMTPFIKPKKANEKRYNEAHARALNVIEKQHKLWKNRFSCFLSPLRCKLPTAQAIITASAVLHNIALTLGDVYEIDSNENMELNIEEQLDDDKIKISTNTQNKDGITKRNSIVATYFNI